MRLQLLPKVSVIIPVYNTAPYLRRCLDSVCAQTLRDIELICINDGSEDDSKSILRDYAARDSRIFLIDFYRNKGVSAARNAGIAIAQGEYLGFVDSDDVINADFYEKLYEKASEANFSIVKGVQLQILEDGTHQKRPANDRIRHNKLDFNWQWSSAIYRTHYIRQHGIDNPPGVTNNEDVAFLLKAVSLVPSVKIVDDAIYYYCRRSSSANSKKLSLPRILSAFRAQDDIVSFINTRSVDEDTYNTLFFQCFSMNHYQSTRANSHEQKAATIACAEAMIRLYTVCKRPEALDENLMRERPDWLPFLQKGNAAMLAAHLLNSLQRPVQKNAAMLRARLLNSGKHSPPPPKLDRFSALRENIRLDMGEKADERPSSLSSKRRPVIIADYEYNPRSRASLAKSAFMELFFKNLNQRELVETLGTMGKYIDRLAKISLMPDEQRPDLPYWDNTFIPPLDAISIYTFLAEFNPRFYVECGSGNTTKFAAKSIHDNKLRTKIISVDPNPRTEVDRLCSAVYRVQFEDMDLNFFNELTDEDIFLVDNSHRSFPNSDTTVFFTEVLPNLPSNMLYAVHDIFLPYDYPEAWNAQRRFYNEQYLLHAYLLGGAMGDSVYFPCHYVAHHEELRHAVDSIFNGPISGIQARVTGGGFFWLRKGRSYGDGI